MVTKENAMQIYNLYSQIEKTTTAIKQLQEVKDKLEKDDRGVEIITANWGNTRTVNISIPSKMIDPKCDNSYSSATIYQVSISDTILVLKSHLKRLKKALKIEQEKVLNN